MTALDPNVPGNPVLESAGTTPDTDWAPDTGNVVVVLIGALILLGSTAYGVTQLNWNLGLAQILWIAGALAVPAPLVVPGSSFLGIPRAVVVRFAAGIVGAYQFMNFGYIGIDTIFGIYAKTTLVMFIGALILMAGAWLLTGGDVIRDVAGLGSIGGRSTPRRLVSLGGVGIVAGWMLLAFTGADYTLVTALVLPVAVVGLTGLWVAGSDGDLRLPIPAEPLVAVCGVATLVMALVWLAGVVPTIGQSNLLGLVGGLVFVLGAAAMAFGGVRDLMPGAQNAS
jgi:hypothetical protein